MNAPLRKALLAPVPPLRAWPVEHPRATIRHAIVELLQQSMSEVARRVYPTRVTPWMQFPNAELPAIGVYTWNERCEDVLDDAHRDVLTRRTLALSVQIIERHIDVIDDRLDALALHVEQALLTREIALPGTGEPPECLALSLTSTEMNVSPVGDKPIGSITLSYDCVYFMPNFVPDPNLCDFERMYVEWVPPATDLISIRKASQSTRAITDGVAFADEMSGQDYFAEDYAFHYVGFSP